MKRFLASGLLVLIVLSLCATQTKVLDEENEYGGPTIKTTFSSGMKYHNEDNVRYIIEYMDADSVVVKADKFLLNGKMSYEYFANGVVQRIEWERPQRTIESIEYYSPDGVIDRIVWLSDSDTPVTTHVEFFTDGEMVRIEREAFEDTPRATEYYEDGHLTHLELYNEDNSLQYVQRYDEKNRLRQRDMYNQNGKLEKEFFYDEKERLERQSWYMRTGRKTVDYYKKDRKVKTEFFNRRGQLTKICYYNDDEVMTRCEKYNSVGEITQTQIIE